MTPREHVLAAIRHEETDRIPYTLAFEDGTDFELDAWYGSAAWRGRVERFIRSVGEIDTRGEHRIDGAHAVDAFGSVWRVDRRPWHLERPALAEPDLDAIEWPGSDAFPLKLAEPPADADPAAEPFRMLDNGWGLFEHAWRIRGFENALSDCVMEEEFYEALLDKLTELRLAMIEKFRDVDADGVLFGDDWGDQRGIIIGPERWRRLLKPRWAKIYEAVHAQGKIVLSHSCGSVADIVPDLIEIGLDVLESVQPEPRGMESFELKRRYGDRIAFWGCLGSQGDIPFGTPDSIRQRVRALCANMAKGGGFILAPAKPIQPGTPPKNAAAVVEALAEETYRRPA